MSDFLFVAAGGVLVVVALGLFRILRGPSHVDRLMATQLFGTGGIAILLLLTSASGLKAAADVALTLALLTAFASITFIKNIPPPPNQSTTSKPDDLSA